MEQEWRENFTARRLSAGLGDPSREVVASYNGTIVKRVFRISDNSARFA